MPQECYVYIADNITSSIRELEGALNRVIAYSVLYHTPITYDTCITALLPVLPQKGQKLITIELIQETVASAHDLSVSDLCSKKRSRDVTIPRQIAMYLCREMTESSLDKIGKSFSKDHSTVIHAHKEIASTLRTGTNPEVSYQVSRIMNELKEA